MSPSSCGTREVAGVRMRCGRITKKGGLCRLVLNGGKCPTHDVDLAARNKAVRRSFRKRDRAAYKAHQVKAGKAGFRAAGLKTDNWAFVNEQSRRWRLKHPSEPERWAIAVLDRASLNHFVREHPVLEGYSLDIAWPDCKRAIEIDGKPSTASPEEQARRAQRQTYKAERLAADGWQILVIDATGDRAAAAEQIVTFAQASQPAETEGEAISF